MSVARKEIDYEDGLRLVQRLVGQGRLPAAARWADHLWHHRPDDPRAHNQAGLVRRRQEQPREAALHFRRAVLLSPEAAELWANLGTALRHAAVFEQAVRCRQRAAACRPEADARTALALALLAAGDYRAGFAEYEHRPDRKTAFARYEKSGLPIWDGRIRPGGRLLVVTEQGAGDVVQFLRFVEPLARQGMHVTVACPPPLRRIVESARGVAATAPFWPDGRIDDHDGLEMLLSIPARLRIDRGSLPAPWRYIDAPEPALRVPRDGTLRVGLCWTGSLFTPLNTMRRMPFDELARVLDVDGPTYYGLQFVTGWRESEGEPRLINLSSHVDDFGDTAALVDQMDLVITVDTSIAHIAGALGKPVWTMLAHVADWRWGHRDATSPWYPSMRLFRQGRPGDWSGVVDRVAGELRRVVARPELLQAPPPFASRQPSG